MNIVPDSSSLIFLGKLGRTDLLLRLYGLVVIVPAAWRESIEAGKSINLLQAAYLEREINVFDRTVITTDEVAFSQRLQTDHSLGPGEAEVLAVSVRRDAVALIDEKKARVAALRLGVKHIGTVGILSTAYQKSIVDYDELLVLFEHFAKIAWVSSAILAEVIKKLKEGTGA